MKQTNIDYHWVSLVLTALFVLPSAFAQHEDDPPPILHEHGAVFDLVPIEETTHLAIASGKWSDPATWLGGEIPTDLSRVLIFEGLEVEMDYVNLAVHKTVRVDGTLRFATDRDTGLRVDTIVVGVKGHLQIGTAADPVQNGIEAKIIIADTGPIDLDWDPNELSRGLISHGRVTIHGAPKTTHLDLAAPALRGQKELTLMEAPLNWSVGDVLILPGTDSRRNYDETLIITGVEGNRVSVAALGDEGFVNSDWTGFSNRHLLPNDLTPFVINVSRNAVIESENVFHADDHGINRRRGHVMFMHSGVAKTDTRFVGAYGLGRTDKRTPLESPEFDEHGHRVPDTGFNTVGRYAWHFHRGGPANGAAVVEGLAIVDSPGLGLVNHSSHVEVSDSVAYNVVGSAFFTEAGNENGFFRNVAAVRMPGSGEGIESRRHPAGVLAEVDFGHSGHGLWLQGGGVDVMDARVAGSGDAAVIFFTVPLDEVGIGTAQFDASLLDDPAVAGGQDTVGVGAVPLHLDGAYVFGCRRGLETKFHQLGANHGVPSVIENATTVWAGTPLTIQYTNNLTVADCQFIGNERSPSGSAMRRNNVTRSTTFEDLEVLWWSMGLDIPVNGHNKVVNGTYMNVSDICISTTKDDDRLVEILGDVQFPDLTEEQLTRGRGDSLRILERHHIHLRTQFNPDDNDITRLFSRDIIRLGTLMYQDHQLFYHAQAADFVPFPGESAADYVPAKFIGLTNGELWGLYGLAIGDAIAPADAIVDPYIHALIGNPIDYAPVIRMRSGKYSNQLADYRLSYDVYSSADGMRTRRQLDAAPIAEGWNLFTFEEEEWLRTLLVFGDITPPEFILSNSTPGVIHPDDLKRGFRVEGTVVDNSFGSRPFRKTFKGSDLLALERLTREDGTEYVELVFTVSDFARNQTEVVFELTLDPSELPAHVKRRVQNSARVVPAALRFLLGFSASTT